MLGTNKVIVVVVVVTLFQLGARLVEIEHEENDERKKGERGLLCRFELLTNFFPVVFLR